MKRILSEEIDFTKFTSDDFLELALRCRHNAIVLRDSANKSFENPSSKNHALFFLYTSSEEFQKGFFCLLAHRGILRPEQLSPVFSKHETKTVLFKMIYDNPKFYIQGGRFYYDGTLLKNLNLSKISEAHHDFVEDYKKERESCIYVTPKADGKCYDPSFKPDGVEEKRQKIMERLSVLWGLFNIIWTHDFDGDLGNFLYTKLTPKDKPVKYNITFSGTGQLIDRKDYFPDHIKKRLEGYTSIEKENKNEAKWKFEYS